LRALPHLLLLFETISKIIIFACWVQFELHHSETVCNGSLSIASVQEEESEYESGSSDDERRLAKPVFVAKGDRETVMEKERLDLEEMQLKEAEQKRAEARVVCFLWSSE
jgi:hypothetical protein